MHNLFRRKKQSKMKQKERKKEKRGKFLSTEYHNLEQNAETNFVTVHKKEKRHVIMKHADISNL